MVKMVPIRFKRRLFIHNTPQHHRCHIKKRHCHKPEWCHRGHYRVFPLRQAHRKPGHGKPQKGTAAIPQENVGPRVPREARIEQEKRHQAETQECHSLHHGGLAAEVGNRPQTDQRNQCQRAGKPVDAV